ncbi:unnamed protein product [Parnassius apollo]|uniref:(apollo) hypothetical protein n=1 Tax=Parnassius apollo TaxID=110799 RepID=A0A8S3WGI9_PARAO|nr:unnamed protein product [Parnassius apollo]
MLVNFITICLPALLFHIISGQCVGTAYNAGVGCTVANDLAYNGMAYGTTLANNAIPGHSSPHGGGFAVTSASPIAPNGVTIVSDNLVVEGSLSVCGQLPILATAAMEGPITAAGQGAVEYGCGDGEVTIISEIVSPDGSYIQVAVPTIDYSLIGLTPNLGCSYVY